MASYPSSMTDSEWKILATLLPAKLDTLRGRPQEHPRRDIIDGILYIIRTGGAWRMMPNDLPHWKTCYHYFPALGQTGILGTDPQRPARHGPPRSWEKKPRPLRLSIVKAFGQLASLEFVVMMRVRRLQEESDMYW